LYSAHDLPLTAGSRLGPYEILSPLGAGGMGEVYKARDTRLERTVAVKVLPQHMAASAEASQRFEREANLFSDGQRFLVNTDTGLVTSAPLTAIVNWTAGLKK